MSTEEKKITIRELQTFIEAVEFAADSENWIPSERQWKRIRAMIDSLVDTPAAKAATVAQPVAAAPAVYAPVIPPQPDRPVQYAQPGGLTMPVHHTAPPAFAGMQPGVPVRTPDIDTSNGSYQSSFGA
jgi:hypothetical protein